MDGTTWHQRKLDIGSHILTTSGDILASYHDVQKSSLATDKLSTFGQGNVILSGEWEYPIGVQYGRKLKDDAIITPRLKATVIDGSDRTDELPNRDASDFRLDEANLFLNNRFQGRDFILPGTHGRRYIWHHQQFNNWRYYWICWSLFQGTGENSIWAYYFRTGRLFRLYCKLINEHPI